MKNNNLLDLRHHRIVEHIWRGLRAILLLTAIVIWLAQDGYQTSDLVILLLCFCAHLCEQLHGLICIIIESMLHYKHDFNKWE